MYYIKKIDDTIEFKAKGIKLSDFNIKSIKDFDKITD
jgi:hypothetical protein